MAYKGLLKDFRRPKKIIFEHGRLDPFYGRFSAGPFERGFGTTIANSLRRTLYSSLQGYAITAIKIYYNSPKYEEPVLLSNEFESIYGVYEDVLEIIQNIKGIRLQLLDESENQVISIQKKGESTLVAKDLAINPNINILNPKLHIATLNAEASISIDFQVSFGRGYVSADRHIEYINEVGTIPIDAIFSPIEKVNFQVEDTRVGQRTDYDKFFLEIWTDGSVSADDALAKAAKILKECFSCFINFEEEEEEEEEIESPEKEALKTLLNTGVEELELSVRSSNCLRVADIRTIGDLVLKTEEEMGQIKNLGKKSVVEISDKLLALDLGFGMKHFAYIMKDKEGA